jgi:hypothetical protein
MQTNSRGCIIEKSLYNKGTKICVYKLSWLLIDRLMTNPKSQEYEDMRRRWIERRSIGVASIMRGLPSREVH